MNEAREIPLVRILVGTFLLFFAVHFCFSAGWKTAGGVIIALPALMILAFPTRQTAYFLLCYIAMCFVIADRTIYVGDTYRIYSQEVLIVLLFLYLLFREGSALDRPLVPVSGKVVAVLTVMGIITAIIEQKPIDLALFYAKGVLLFLPIFFCIRRIVTNERVLQNICIFLVAAGLVGSVMSIADYHGFGIAKVIFGETEKEASVDARLEETLAFEHPFHRTTALHTFHLFTGVSIYLIFFLTLYLYHSLKSQKIRFFLRFSQLSYLVYIFHTGYRSIWIAFVISLCIYALHRGAKGLIGFALAALLVVSVLPASVTDRLMGLGIGGEIDSSVQERADRAENAIQVIREKMIFGGGWGSAGLVHNDFLQMGADSGIATPIVFCVFYGGILFRLYRRYWRAVRQGRKRESHCMNVFFSALTGYLFMWATGGHFNVQHTFIIFWMILAMAAKVTHLPIGESAEMESKHNIHAAQFAT